MARCFPDRATVDAFRVPLTPGERHLLDALLAHLDDRYEVYVQPFLNGDRPDFVVVRPDAGVLIVEVKDWRLGAYTTEGGRWRLAADGTPVRSPLAQLARYKDNLFALHATALFERRLRAPRTVAVVSCVAYFHRASTAEARAACGPFPPYTDVLGRDALGPEALRGLLQRLRLDRPSRLFDGALYRAVRRYLRPPVHSPDEGRAIAYTPKQEALIESQPDVARKVRGVAGCGKSLVLAARAVRAHERTGGRVLVLTFNITLRHYLRDRISEVRAGFPWSAFHITHYHHLVAAEANNAGLDIGNPLAAADDERLFEPVRDRLPRYDAVFIDEVQDYKEPWIRLVKRYFLAEGGELVVFGDEKQNVYDRPLDERRMPNTTIPGRWNELTDSFRLHRRSVDLARAFHDAFYGDRYRPDADVEVRQTDLFDAPPRMAHVRPEATDPDALFAVVQGALRAWDVHPDDVSLVAPRVEALCPLEARFRRHGERTTAAFETEEEAALLERRHGAGTPAFRRAVDDVRRHRKYNFQMHAGTVKLSTIHSFKGWEIHTLVLLLPPPTGGGDDANDELVYTALTRCRHNLLVVDLGDPRYRAFFEAHLTPLDATVARAVRAPRGAGKPTERAAS